MQPYQALWQFTAVMSIKGLPNPKSAEDILETFFPLCSSALSQCVNATPSGLDPWNPSSAAFTGVPWAQKHFRSHFKSKRCSRVQVRPALSRVFWQLVAVLFALMQLRKKFCDKFTCCHSRRWPGPAHP
jgi:hypothetical protein